MSIVLFDTETTGLLKPDANELKAQPYITELFALKVDGNLNEIGKLHLLMKPPVPLSAEITRITGLRNEDLADKPSFAESFEELVDFFMGADTMVAHNLPFDRSMLANEMLRIDKVLNFPWPPNHICTVEKSMYLEQRRINLTKLHEYATGKPEIPGAHRAENDVRAMFEGYKWLVEQGRI